MVIVRKAVNVPICHTRVLLADVISAALHIA